MKRALLVVDVQNEYFTGKMPVTYPEGSFDNMLKVVDATNKSQIPVIFIRHTAPQKDAATFAKGSREWEIHEELFKKRSCSYC